MPNALLRACSHQPCPNLVERGACPEHTKQANQRRGSAASRGYGSRWRRYRATWLRKHPFCGDREDGQSAEHSRCVQQGIVTDCTLPGQGHVDHIVPIDGERDPLFWDRRNHQTLCVSCHSAKTARENGGQGMGV